MQYEHLPTSNDILLLHPVQPCTGAIHFSISYEDCLSAILGICIAKMHIARRYHPIQDSIQLRPPQEAAAMTMTTAEERHGLIEGSLEVKLLLLAKASKLTFCRLMSRPPYVCTRPTYAVVFLVIFGENYGRPLNIRGGITSHCASYFW